MTPPMLDKLDVTTEQLTNRILLLLNEVFIWHVGCFMKNIVTRSLTIIGIMQHNMYEYNTNRFKIQLRTADVKSLGLGIEPSYLVSFAIYL